MANTFAGGTTATGGTITAGANGALGTAGVNLDGVVLAVSDPAVNRIDNNVGVGTNGVSLQSADGIFVTHGGLWTTFGTTQGVGIAKGDVRTFNVLTKNGAGTNVFTNSVGTQMSYTTGTNAGVTTSGGIKLDINAGAVVFGSTRTMNLASGTSTDTFDTNTTPPTQLTSYNGMVWNGDFYLQSGTVQINGGNIRGTGKIYVQGAGTFAHRLNFSSPDIDNDVDVAPAGFLKLSAA